MAWSSSFIFRAGAPQGMLKRLVICALICDPKPSVKRPMPWGAPARKMKELLQAIHAIWDSWYDGKPLDPSPLAYRATFVLLAMIVLSAYLVYRRIPPLTTRPG